MKKQNFLVVVLIAGFVYFLGSTLHSQTTYDDKNCKCCGEECITNNCCTNCVTGEAQGVATDCCANCTSDACKECCAAGCAMNSNAPGSTSDDNMKGCDGTGNCCSKSAGATTDQNNCSNKTK